MGENWAQSPDAIMDNPIGGIRRGWSEISQVYQQLFRADAKFLFEFYDCCIHEGGEVFYAVGRERGRFEVGQIALEMAIRTTRIFRKMNGHWRQVHHHGSIEDASLLRAYQEAVQ
jgi:ketosteroid isomerase-like protein